MGHNRLRSLRAPCLQFQCRGPGRTTLGKVGIHPKLPPSLGAGLQVQRASCLALSPSPLLGPLSMPRRAGQAVAVAAGHSHGCSRREAPKAPRASGAKVSEAVESRPGSRQPLPPPCFVFKKEKKERKWGVEGFTGQGSEHGGEKQRWQVGEGSPRRGQASVGV